MLSKCHTEAVFALRVAIVRRRVEVAPALHPRCVHRRKGLRFTDVLKQPRDARAAETERVQLDTAAAEPSNSVRLFKIFDFCHGSVPWIRLAFSAYALTPVSHSICRRCRARIASQFQSIPSPGDAGAVA